MDADLVTKFRDRDNEYAKRGSSVLGDLIVGNHFELAEDLLSNGFEFRDFDTGIFLVAAKRDDLKAVSFMLSHGFDANTRSAFDQTGLHACRKGATAQLLIRAGTDVNAQDSEGNTALHLSYQEDKARVLLEHGASLAIKNNHDLTPERYLALWANSREVSGGYERVAVATKAHLERHAIMSVLELREPRKTVRRAL